MINPRQNKSKTQQLLNCNDTSSILYQKSLNTDSNLNVSANFRVKDDS